MIIELISKYHKSKLKYFKCGDKDLDIFLKCYALENSDKGYGKTFLLIDNNKIIGYFTLCSGQTNFNELPDNSNLPRYPIPSIRIARLAVDKTVQSKGYGKYLLKQAFIKILDAANTIGIYLIIVDAKDQSISFYEQYGFKKLLNNKNTFYLTLAELKESNQDN